MTRADPHRSHLQLPLPHSAGVHGALPLPPPRHIRFSTRHCSFLQSPEHKRHQQLPPPLFLSACWWVHFSYSFLFRDLCSSTPWPNTLTVTDTSPLSPSASWCYFLTRTLLSPPAWLPTLLFSTSSSPQRPCRRPQPTPELHTHSQGHSSPCSPALHTTSSTGVQPVGCTGLQRTRLPPSFIYGGHSQSPTRKQQCGFQMKPAM